LPDTTVLHLFKVRTGSFDQIRHLTPLLDKVINYKLEQHPTVPSFLIHHPSDRARSLFSTFSLRRPTTVFYLQQLTTLDRFFPSSVRRAGF
jgi:hypothetical protein